jgi:hypothetical protein
VPDASFAVHQVRSAAVQRESQSWQSGGRTHGSQVPAWPGIEFGEEHYYNFRFQPTTERRAAKTGRSGLSFQTKTAPQRQSDSPSSEAHKPEVPLARQTSQTHPHPCLPFLALRECRRGESGGALSGFLMCFPRSAEPAPKKSSGSFRSIRYPGHAPAFEAAHRSRIWLPFKQIFRLIPPVRALPLGFSVLAWVPLGFWLNACHRQDSGHARRVARDSLRQTAFGIVSLAAFQYLLRPELPLSRWSFLALFALCSWALLCAFWLAVRNTAGMIRREFSARRTACSWWGRGRASAGWALPRCRRSLQRRMTSTSTTGRPRWS